MVKAVVGEESQLKLAEDRLSQAALPSEVLRRLWISAFPTFFFFFLFFFPPEFRGWFTDKIFTGRACDWEIEQKFR